MKATSVIRSMRDFAGRHPRAAFPGGRGVAAVSGGIVLALTLALTGSPTPASARPIATTGAPTAPATAPGQLVSPFTGEPVAALRPVIAVKVDNIVYARPQTGLRDADIVYVLPVEGGLSRFLAVYSSHLPPVIGPVRSAREDDLAVLRQFGTPALAYSGAAPQLLPYVHQARIVDLYAGLPGVAGAYYRGSQRIAPYNLYVRTPALLADAKGASTAHDIGFRFGPVPASAQGRAVAAVTTGYPAASFTFRWSATAGQWLVWMDGSPARATEGGQAERLGAPTIVIQHTVIRTSRFLEYGKPPPYADSTGSGTAVVLRGGRAYTVGWSRPSANAGTTYTLPGGQRMTFAKGQVWVLLVGAAQLARHPAARARRPGSRDTRAGRDVRTKLLLLLTSS